MLMYVMTFLKMKDRYIIGILLFSCLITFSIGFVCKQSCEMDVCQDWCLPFSIFSFAFVVTILVGYILILMWYCCTSTHTYEVLDTSVDTLRDQLDEQPIVDLEV